MRRDQVAQVEHAPRRVGDEVAAQRVRVPADLFVHAREDLLLPGLVPGDADACRRARSRALRRESTRARCPAPSPGTAWSDSSRRSGSCAAAGRVEIARQAVALRVFVAGHRILPANQCRRPPWRRRRTRSGTRNLQTRCAASSGSPLCVAHQADDVRAGRRRIARARAPAGTDIPARRFRNRRCRPGRRNRRCR